MCASADRVGDRLRTDTLGAVSKRDYYEVLGTGRDAIFALRAARGEPIPAIVITADHTPELQRLLRDDGIALLRKPVKAAALRALLSQIRLQRLAAE